MSALDNEVVERLAAYCHDKQWSGWMRYLFKRCRMSADGSATILPHFAKRWTRQMSTPYSELPEDEKESDRIEARAILKVVGGEALRQRVAELEGALSYYANVEENIGECGCYLRLNDDGLLVHDDGFVAHVALYPEQHTAEYGKRMLDAVFGEAGKEAEG
jgi:hypothetical protein